MNKTSIPWADLTWNPITGCTKGCPYCYARTTALMRQKNPNPKVAHAYRNGFAPTTHPNRLDEPLRLRKPNRIFLGSMGDLFDPAFPDEFRDRVFHTIAHAPQHTFILLTKQPEEMRSYMTGWYWRHEERPGFPNLWLGVTATNQADADERIPLLLDTPAAVRFVSVEPMLGPVSLYPGYLSLNNVSLLPDGRPKPTLDWVVVGGKTPGSPLHEWMVGQYSEERGFHNTPADWLRSLRDQCAGTGTAFFYKHGGTTPALDGVVYDQYPGVPR